MAVEVHATASPGQVLERAGAFLEQDPVRHNVILTLLGLRVATPEPGEYWIVEIDNDVVGAVFHSPLLFVASVTPMPAEAVVAVVDVIADQGVELPGVTGEAATAARFAGHWTERTRSSAVPFEGQRIYEVDEVVAAAPAAGHLRPAVTADRDLLVEWVDAFMAETHDVAVNTGGVVDRRLRAGQLWIWEADGASVSFAGVSDSVAGVARVGPV